MGGAGKMGGAPAVNVERVFFSLQDPRFNQAVDKQTGYKTKSILCVPIKAPDGHVRLPISSIVKVVIICICCSVGYGSSPGHQQKRWRWCFHRGRH